MGNNQTFELKCLTLLRLCITSFTTNRLAVWEFSCLNFFFSRENNLFNWMLNIYFLRRTLSSLFHFFLPQTTNLSFHPLLHLPIHSFIHQLTTFVIKSTTAFNNPLLHSSIYKFAYQSTRSFKNPFLHSSIHSFIN